MTRNKPPRGGDRTLLESLWRNAPERYTLPNGLTVLLQSDRATPICSVQVWVKTGSIHEAAHLGAGLSHYLEHMLFKGTEKRSGREISATVQASGGYINAYTTFDRTVYYVDIPSENADVALEILADATLRSTLPAEEVEKEKEVILREIDMCMDDPDQRLGQSLFETAFRVHPFRQPIIGHREVFATTSRADLQRYYQERYTPNNMVVIVAGDFSAEAIRAGIERHFGCTPRRRMAPVLVPDEPSQLARREAHRFEDVQVSRCGLGWQVPGLAHPDAPALEMLAMVLGHGDSSILWQQLREKARLVHSIDAMTWNPGICGLFYVSYLADPGKRAAAERAVISTLNATADRGIGITALAKAVRQAVTAEVNMRKTMSGQAARLGAAEVVVGDLDYNRRYFERLFALRPSDLRRVLRTYLVPERLTVVSSNPQTASVAVVAPAVASAGSLDFIEELLPNGSRLLLQPNRHLPNLHLRLVFAGGPLHEPAGRRGANALMATMLTKDTKVRTAEQVARLIEQAGGRLADFSGNNSFGLYAEVLPADTALAIELLGDGVMRPAFTAARLDVERECALAALRESLDDVVTVGRKKLRGIFFGDHPFAVESCGDEPGLGATRSSDLIALHRRLVVAGNTVLAAAGDFDLKKLAPRLRALLARLPRGIADAAERARSPACGDHVETQPRQQAVVFEAYPGPGVRSADYYVGEVADELFSGMSSNLFEQVREKKSLAYFVRSSRMSGLDTAMFYFFAGTSPERHTEVLAEFAAEIARVKRGGVAADELRRCQTRLKAGRRMSMQANGARAMQAALNAIYGLPVNDWRHYDAKIDAVTLDDLAAFALRYFVPRKRVRLVVRPEAAGGNIRDFP